MSLIHKAGLLVVREGRLLLCRKRHTTSLLILPGGRIEPGETPEQCIEREAMEELGVEARNLAYVGTYSDRAAGMEAIVQIDLYRGELAGEPIASAEIAELVWFAANDDPDLLSPSLRNKIIPDLLRRDLLKG